MDENSRVTMIKGLFDMAAKMIERHNIEVQEFTQDQVASLIVQAIMSGDFQKHTVHDFISLPFMGSGVQTHIGIDTVQSVTYIPYREVIELREENARLKEEIEKLKGVSDGL